MSTFASPPRALIVPRIISGREYSAWPSRGPRSRGTSRSDSRVIGALVAERYAEQAVWGPMACH
jgi:hypothetical protein